MDIQVAFSQKSIKLSIKFIFLFIIFNSLVFLNTYAFATKTFPVLFVDKKTNSLFLTEYREDKFQVIKTFHTTLGKVQGDKEAEGDLKTPEGIYIFKSKLYPPQLKPKFGAIAFYMNYPNPYDVLTKHTGSNIMLHATNEPERLKKDFDSEGCVVVKNEEIEELQSHIRLGLTPILIFNELSEEYYHPGKDQRLRSFFEFWIKNWEEKNIENYIDYYHSAFTAQGMGKTQWKSYKNSLNVRYNTIRINPKNVLFYRHPKYSMITFMQNYYSTLRNGKVGFHSQGTKIIYVTEEQGKPKIIAENFTSLTW